MFLALLIFLPTIIFFPHYLYAAGIFYIPKKFRIDLNLLIIITIIIISLVNRILHLSYNSNEFALIPYTAIYILTYFFSRSLDKKSLKFILIFIFIESIVAILEFIFSTPTFFKELVTSKLSQWYSSGLLYYQRSFGLSNNSSEIAFKIFVAFLILDLNVISNRIYKNILYIIFFIGLIVTFNRSVIVSLLIFYFLKNIVTIKNILFKFKIRIYILIIIFLIITFILFYFDIIIEQFTRGISITSDFQKRFAVTNYFLQFISSHFFFGNGSYKLYYFYNNEFYHAHNSFLQVFATHGFIIFLLYLILIINNIDRSNLKYILPFIVLSLTQYGIFWGISILDIFFLYFLIFLKNDKSISKFNYNNYTC